MDQKINKLRTGEQCHINSIEREVEYFSLSIKPSPHESRHLLMTILAGGMYLVMEIFLEAEAEKICSLPLRSLFNKLIWAV